MAEHDSNSFRRFPVLFGLAWSLFVTAVGALLVAMWAHFGSASAAQLDTAAYCIRCAAVICGALISSRAGATRGWYYGGVVGLSYAGILLGIGLGLYPDTTALDPASVLRVCIISLIGAFTGIIGASTTRIED
ncbi:TIGR04086 family membrane protein [Alicyclobacillus shizuokensis]|uniref:TIGR04086 family membrane protein n=1 Tax=Alicyclobacillus shizuokensis TaxID=392014 RepID=UPI00082C5970|nr:TIGR04086 family membrane protein [Alicyclobacillus shizuokensis]MCL6625984.1 TIGR04086 family membrane protein [Alicyclobacillus shizuokensis]